MQIEIDKRLCEQMQTLTTLPMKPEHVEYFAEFFLEFGIASVSVALRQNPGLSFGDLVMLRYRIEHH